MRRLLLSGLSLALAVGGALAQAPMSDAAAVAEELPSIWEVCNETSYILRMAVATQGPETMSAKGWQRLRSGDCTEIDAAIDQPRYVYAESSAAYQGGIREWTGKTPFCVGDVNFDISGLQACQAAGYETRNYLVVDRTEAVTRFVEPDDFSRRAETAGLQRLLRENGYRVTRIDGVAGRRTARTLAQFVKDKKLAANLTDSQKMDALEKAAIKRIEDLGVKLCNKSSGRIWAATADKRKDNWESRGWWAVEPGACIQPVTASLEGANTHIFARQEQPRAEDGSDVADKHLRSESAEPAQFCMSEARFSARGRDNCADNGYQAVTFRTLPNDKNGVTLNLTNSDFAAKSRSGLRR